MPAIGWVATLSEAGTIVTQRLEADAWTTTDARKTAALWTAWKRLVYSGGRFALDPTTPASDVLKEAQVEMAIYLLQQMKGEDVRRALQAQGVKSAGIVQETYGGDPREIAYPASVCGILGDYDNSIGAAFMVPIGRNENQPIDEEIADGYVGPTTFEDDTWPSGSNIEDIGQIPDHT